MRRYLHYKSFRAALLVVLIWLILPVQCGGEPGAEKKPRIGLIQFSIDVFENQKKIVEEVRKLAVGSLKKFFKDNNSIFGKAFYFKNNRDIITYSDIEDPDVTIDPMFESRANKKLKELSDKYNLDAIVFGHFQEEDDLIVVFRYYTAQDRKIVSTRSEKIKIDKQFEANLKMAVNNVAAELEEKLKDKFEKKTPAPTEAKKVPEQSTKTPKKNKTDVQRPNVKKIENSEEELTALEVYRMIENNGFYCGILRGSPIHDEAMETIEKSKKIKNDLFPLNRNISAKQISENIIESESKLKLSSTKYIGSNIKINWNKFEDNKIPYVSFDKAQKEIEKLNEKMKENGKTEVWRIPTLKELFSIVKGDKPKRFPWAFKLPDEKRVIIWSSTKVKKEKTKLGGDKKHKAYFVIRRKLDDNKGIYSIHFMHQNIEGGNKKKAFLLPVFSDKEHRYKPIDHPLSDTIPGFDDLPDRLDHPGEQKNNDRIPGFDDFPDPSPDQSSRKTNPSKSNEQEQFPLTLNRPKIKVLLLPFINISQIGKIKLGFPFDITERVMEALKKLKNEVFTICDLEISERASENKARQLYDIIKNKKLNEASKLSKIREGIDNLRFRITDFNIVVMGTLGRDENRDIISFHIIDFINNKIIPEYPGEMPPDFNRIKERIKKQIIEGKSKRKK